MQKELRATLASQLVTTAAAVMLAAALAACGSAVAPQSAAAPEAGQAAAAGGAHGSSSGDPAASAAGPSIPAAARRVRCPAGVPGVVHLPGHLPGGSQPPQPAGTQPIPAGFRPAAVVECIRVFASLPGGKVEIAERRQVAVTGLGGVLAALRRPSTARPRGPVPACVVPASAIPWFVLIGADGQVIHPHVPIGLCGVPIPPVLTALSSLHWKTLSTTSVAPGGLQPPLRSRPAPDVTPVISAPNSGVRT
jgi:hypothetical protein